MTSDEIEYKRPNLKSTSPQRWLMLFLGCIMMIGSYYSLDVPAAVKNQLNSYMDGPKDYETKFQLLYTLYAAPNVGWSSFARAFQSNVPYQVILPIFGGFIIDHFGVRTSMLLFCTLITIGQIIVSIGISTGSWSTVYLGRMVFGLGGESFTVANTAFLTEWFIGNELAFAFGFNLSFGRLGSVFNNIMSPYLVRQFDYLPAAFWFGSVLCVLCLFVVIITLPLDRAMEESLGSGVAPDGRQFSRLSTMDDGSVHNALADKREGGVIVSDVSLIESGSGVVRRRAPSHESAGETSPEASTGKHRTVNSLSGALAATWLDLQSFRIIFWVLGASCFLVYGVVYPFNNISSSLLLERDYFRAPTSPECRLQYAGCQNATNLPTSACPSSSLYHPPLPHQVEVDGAWYDQVTASHVDCTESVWQGSSSAAGCTQEYCSLLATAESRASYVMSIPYTISAILSPPLGFVVDRFGWRAAISLCAPVILVLVHSTLAANDAISPVIPLFGQGLAFTGYVAVLWPAVPLVVEDRVLGLAYGVVTGLQNFGVAVLPLLVAAVYNGSGHRYLPNVEFLFVGMALMGTVVGLYMNWYDIRHGSILNRGLQEDPSLEGEGARAEASHRGEVEESDDLDVMVGSSSNGKQYFQLKAVSLANN